MKLNHILFPVDFSESSLALNREVEWVANHFNADVTLLHVFEVPTTWYEIGEAPPINNDCFLQLTAAARQRLMNYPIQLPANRVSHTLAEGDAAWNIKNWVEEHDVDLLMMGTHGSGSMHRLLLGSVAMKVMHYVDCPVWTHSLNKTTPVKRPMVISRILCALELTEETIRLLQFVKAFAADFGASVRLLHSVPKSEFRPYRYFDADLHKYVKECAAKDASRYQQEAGTDYPITITDGFIGEDAAALALEEGVDLVVIGRGKTQRVFGTLRTHCYDIIRQAPCPVISYCRDGAAADSLALGKQNQSERR